MTHRPSAADRGRRRRDRGRHRRCRQQVRGIGAGLPSASRSFGGTLDNKVAQTLARRRCVDARLRQRCGCNFRGVGASAGQRTTTASARPTTCCAVIDACARSASAICRWCWRGFSFGAYVQTRVGKRSREAGTPPQRVVLVGTAAGHVTGGRSYATEPVPADTIVIHGEVDDTVPLCPTCSTGRGRRTCR
ncbi:MAG: hypothetical protein MZV65_44185 [Chromatiales bacterium]|nr:hypothetical protein [Chromatiales bacterium]